METANQKLTQIERELETARSVQSDLLPKSRLMTNLDVVVNCAPAEHVGGDICDVFEADHGRTAVVVGDVSGKGLPAGILTGIVYGAVHSGPWTESSFQHEEASEKLNDFLRRKTSADRFVSLFWGYYEPEVSQFRYINAGHLPMLLIRRTTGQRSRVERLETGGPVLGIVPWGNYRQGTVRIEEGDLLVLFSDGIVEAMDQRHDQFGEKRLIDVIQKFADASPAEIQDAILTCVRDHAGTEHPDRDDQTLLVARFHDVFTGIHSSPIQELAV